MVRMKTVTMSSTSVRPRSFGLRAKTESPERNPSGAKAPIDFPAFAARLKSCPDTSCRFARDFLCSLKLAERHPSGAKAPIDFPAFAARLKPCPFKTPGPKGRVVAEPDSRGLKAPAPSADDSGVRTKAFAPSVGVSWAQEPCSFRSSNVLVVRRES